MVKHKSVFCIPLFEYTYIYNTYNEVRAKYINYFILPNYFFDMMSFEFCGPLVGQL